VSTPSEHLRRLQRRADHLAARLACAAPGINLSYDKAELSSLLWAIDQLASLYHAPQTVSWGDTREKSDGR
jgi:hypothetical protein